MKNIQIITDANRTQHVSQVFEASERVNGAIQLCETDAEFCGYEGFGVAITGSSCYMLNSMPSDERRELLGRLYSKDGIGLSVARLTIGSSDYSAELYSYDDTPFDTDLSHFSIERDKAYIIPMIKEILEVNPELYIFASPWSPPGWMKTGGKLCGGYMRAEFVDVYADYIVKYIEAYAKEGIRISAVTPQNEPNTEQRGRMPACVWHPEIEAAFTLALKARLRARGLDTKIWMHDHNFDDVDRVLWLLDNTENLKESCDGIAFHYYSGSVEQTAILRERYPQHRMHFTEGGPRLYDNYGTDHCKWASMMINTICHGYGSFTGWNLMLDETGNPNIGPFGCGGLVTRNSVTGELTYSGQYNAFAHLSPCIKKTSVIRPLTVEGGLGQDMSRYPATVKAPVGITIDGTTAVIVNANAQKLQLQLTLGGKLLYVELPPDSVSTVKAPR